MSYAMPVADRQIEAASARGLDDVGEARAPRFLGAAYLVVVLTSLTGGLLIASATGSGSMSDVLVGVASAETTMRLGVFAGLATSLGVIVLAALLYVVLRGESRVLALIALGWWLAEAIVLAVGRIGDAALIPLSRSFVAAGAPADSYHQALAEVLYRGFDQQLGSTVHMLFYCAGGLIWYALFLRSGFIPRAISLFGLVAVTLALAGIVAEILGFDVPIAVYLPILPFELVIGTWLILRGIRTDTDPVHTAGGASPSSVDSRVRTPG